MLKVNYVDAIRHLVPNAEFSYTNNDLSTIVWDAPKGKRPSDEEILDALEIVKELKENEAQAKATARAAILDRLGLTAEEAAILLG